MAIKTQLMGIKGFSEVSLGIPLGSRLKNLSNKSFYATVYISLPRTGFVKHSYPYSHHEGSLTLSEGCPAVNRKAKDA
tara:strand:+ start:95392 stop:95625 length:234 start_codon:yes stop_codon:yes gene_type:complete